MVKQHLFSRCICSEKCLLKYLFCSLGSSRLRKNYQYPMSCDGITWPFYERCCIGTECFERQVHTPGRYSTYVRVYNYIVNVSILLRSCFISEGLMLCVIESKCLLRRRLPCQKDDTKLLYWMKLTGTILSHSIVLECKSDFYFSEIILLSLVKKTVLTCSNVGQDCWEGGGVGGQFPLGPRWPSLRSPDVWAPVQFFNVLFSMTDGAQQALRRTMEIYSKTTRFALACNISDKIIGKSSFRDWECMNALILLISKSILHCE